MVSLISLAQSRVVQCLEQLLNAKHSQVSLDAWILVTKSTSKRNV